MDNNKQQMSDVAVLYYKKNYTQQQIADCLGITRQTVSKLLNQATESKIVNISIARPCEILSGLEKELSDKLMVNAYVGGCSSGEDVLREEATVFKACSYLTPEISKGNLKIGVSWGKTIEGVIANFNGIKTENNVVFPILGVTSRDKSCYYTDKLAYDLAKAIDGKIEYATFPYLVCRNDYELIKETSIYKNVNKLWNEMDIAVVGIGNLLTLGVLQDYLPKSEIPTDTAGDIATHLFNKQGKIIELYNQSLCASFESIKNAKNTVAIACGKDKVDSIISAIKTGAVNTFITDEFTAREILEK